MTRMKLFVAALLMIAAPCLSFAEEAPKWGYIEGGYTDFDPDGGLSDDGWFAGASINFLKNFHIVAEYNDVGDYTLWNAGFGWHGMLGDPADIFAEVVWNDVKVDSSNFSDDGYGFSAGIRWKLIKWFELKGQANWNDYDQGDSDTLFEAGALFLFLNDRLGIGATYETGDADTMRGFVRFNFGK